MTATVEIGSLVELDAQVDAAEGEGLLARWEFGRELLARRVGKQLPKGLLDELTAATGKSQRELQYRIQFAERFATEDEVRTAVRTWRSWTEIRSQALPSTIGTLGSSESDEWYTPADYIEAARRVMGGIDLDPASCDAANEVVQADRYFTISDDGLAQPWAGRVFMNPPFGRDGSPAFVEKLLAEHDAGRVTEAVLLCAARLETAWFQPLFDHLLCFPNHRVRFWQPGRTPAPPFTPAFAYLGPLPDAFVNEFSAFGPVVRRVDGAAT